MESITCDSDEKYLDRGEEAPPSGFSEANHPSFIHPEGTPCAGSFTERLCPCPRSLVTWPLHRRHSLLVGGTSTCCWAHPHEPLPGPSPLRTPPRGCCCICDPCGLFLGSHLRLKCQPVSSRGSSLHVWRLLDVWTTRGCGTAGGVSLTQRAGLGGRFCFLAVPHRASWMWARLWLCWGEPARDSFSDRPTAPMCYGGAL